MVDCNGDKMPCDDERCHQQIMSDLTTQLSEIGLMPILTIKEAETAVPTAQALIAGGINCGEVVFRTAAAAESIRRIAAAFPDFLVGAGTIITVAQAEEALAAGAQYLIAPGFSAELAQFCQANNVPLFPGVMTGSEVTAALLHGLDTLKLFPAAAAGGIPLLKAFAGPFYNVKFMPTGGINADNLADYLRLPNIVTCGGSWFTKQATYAQITERAAAAMETVRRVRFE